MEPADRYHGAEVLIASELIEPALADALLGALRPRSLGERVRLWVSGGWSAKQTWERLSDPVQRSLLAATGEDQRKAIDRVYRALLALASAGRIARKQVKYTMRLNTKGPRDMLVDLFSASRPA